MFARNFMWCIMLFLFVFEIYGQEIPEQEWFRGIVYDAQYRPLPYTHIINLDSRQGDVSDSLGVFLVPAESGDHLLFRNVAYKDTVIEVEAGTGSIYIVMEKKVYVIGEVKVFDWGSSYQEFLDAARSMEDQPSMTEELGLPTQDPDFIPYYLDEKKIESVGFLINSPVSFLYYNLSRKEKSARKVYRLKKDHDLISKFKEVYNRERIAEITGLRGDQLEAFMRFLNEHFLCTYECKEIEILQEIYQWFEAYEEINMQVPQG